MAEPASDRPAADDRPANQAATSGLSGCRTGGESQVSRAGTLYGREWRKIAARPGQSTVAGKPDLDTNWRKETKNGYDFHIDVIARNRRTYGGLSLAVAPLRSRRNQAQAGKPDRLASDDGGHFIAARFNGPRDSFNHFAQDANFNRGSYRAMEDIWAKDLRAGHQVFVDIVPLYHGTSKRPYSLIVTWEIDGKKVTQKFPNEAKGRRGGNR